MTPYSVCAQALGTLKADASKFPGNNDPQILRPSHNAVKIDSIDFITY